MESSIYYMFAAVIFSAGVLQSLSGFGFALLAVPLMAAVLPASEVVPLVVLLSLGVNSAVLFQARQHLRLKEIWPLVLFGVVATPLGVIFLKILDDGIMKGVVGVVTCLAAILLLSGLRVKLQHEKRWMGPVGALGGLLGGSVSLNGPPVVIFFAATKRPKNEFRANLAAYFLVLNLATAAAQALAGLFIPDVLYLAATGVVPLGLGIGLGIVLSQKVRQAFFDKLVPSVILCMGMVALASALNML